MKDLIDVAAVVQAFCEQRGWRFCFIGGLAVQHLAEARLTKDTDLTLFTGFGDEEPFIDELLTAFKPRRPDAKAFALINRVLLLYGANGSGIDIALGALPFEAEAVERASYAEYAPGVFLKICSPEDLIVMKAFASRPRDWEDIRMTLVRQGVGTLNWSHIRRHLTELAALKEAPEILDQLEALKARYS